MMKGKSSNLWLWIISGLILFSAVLSFYSFGFLNKDQEINCSKLELVALESDSILKLWLKSDLPDYTVVLVDVSRVNWSYNDTYDYEAIERQKIWIGETPPPSPPLTMTLPYLHEAATLKKWNRLNSIDVDSKKWLATLNKEKQQLLVQMTQNVLDFKDSYSSNTIDVSVSVPKNQFDPRFSEQCANLIQQSPQDSDYFYVIQKKIEKAI